MDQRVLVLFLLVWAGVEASNATTGSSWNVVLKVFENCADKNDSLTCLQQKVLNFASRLTQAKSLEIFDGLKFIRDEQTARSMSETQTNNVGASLSDQIWNEVVTFFKTHSVEMNIPKFLDTDNEARGKKNKGGGILLLAGALKGAMIYMGMHAIAALAGKALLVAKVALTIASVIALKKLLEGSGGKTSYEIVKHPQHSYVQTHSSSHEYGGGGHGGGGYEGHYRKRSIAKPKVNFHEGSADSWRFELPKRDAGVRFSPSYDPNEYQIVNNGGSNEGADFFLYKQIADQNQGDTSNHNLQFALELDGKNGEPDVGEEVGLNHEKDFSPLRLRRSLLRNFA